MPWPACLIVTDIQRVCGVWNFQASGRLGRRNEAWRCLLSILDGVLAAGVVKTVACEQAKRSCVG